MGWVMRRPLLITNETRLHWVMAGMNGVKKDGDGSLTLGSYLFQKVEANMHTLSSVTSLTYICDIHLLLT